MKKYFNLFLLTAFVFAFVFILTFIFTSSLSAQTPSVIDTTQPTFSDSFEDSFDNNKIKTKGFFVEEGTGVLKYRVVDGINSLSTGTILEERNATQREADSYQRKILEQKRNQLVQTLSDTNSQLNTIIQYFDDVQNTRRVATFSELAQRLEELAINQQRILEYLELD